MLIYTLWERVRYNWLLQPLRNITFWVILNLRWACSIAVILLQAIRILSNLQVKKVCLSKHIFCLGSFWDFLILDRSLTLFQTTYTYHESISIIIIIDIGRYLLLKLLEKGTLAIMIQINNKEYILREKVKIHKWRSMHSFTKMKIII